MSAPVAILRTGLVSSVGLSAPATCAAIRAGVANPTTTRFIDSAGEWLTAHQVGLERPWRGMTRLVKMAASAIRECLVDVDSADWSALPLLLCVAERERPGRADGLDDQLFQGIERELGIQFFPESRILPHGRVSLGAAFMVARKLIYENRIPRVLVAAVDSLLSWSTLSHYERAGRLLTAENSNGFTAGEGAGAVLLSAPNGRAQLVCTGMGGAVEAAHIDTEEPLRGDGLTAAITEALTDAGLHMNDMDFRITDLSGEHYYFKEATLALARTLRKHKTEFELWHPAECIGEVGAPAGAAIIAMADSAFRKNFARGPRVLAHMANDAGRRAALALEFRGAS